MKTASPVRSSTPTAAKPIMTMILLPVTITMIGVVKLGAFSMAIVSASMAAIILKIISRRISRLIMMIGMCWQ